MPARAGKDLAGQVAIFEYSSRSSQVIIQALHPQWIMRKTSWLGYVSVTPGSQGDVPRGRWPRAERGKGYGTPKSQLRGVFVAYSLLGSAQMPSLSIGRGVTATDSAQPSGR